MSVASINSYYTSTQSPLEQSTKSSNSELDFNDLLKIIVTQLGQQDPSKAASTTDLVNQYMSIANLQASTTLKSNSESTASQDRQNYAVNLIGKKVVVFDENNQPVTGLVEGSRVLDKSVLITVSGKEYDSKFIQNYLQQS